MTILRFFGIVSVNFSEEAILQQAREQLGCQKISNKNAPKWATELAKGQFKDIPIHLDGTRFQKNVWHALKNLPAGETITYSDFAKFLGIPKSTRSVASAIARNPVSLLIPCHRVVPKSNRPQKYRWGPEIKKELNRIKI